MRKKKKRTLSKQTFRSGFEERIASQLRRCGIKYTYESLVIEYKRLSTYTPDFILPNGIIIETKGRWVTEDPARRPGLALRGAGGSSWACATTTCTTATAARRTSSSLAIWTRRSPGADMFAAVARGRRGASGADDGAFQHDSVSLKGQGCRRPPSPRRFQRSSSVTLDNDIYSFSS